MSWITTLAIALAMIAHYGAGKEKRRRDFLKSVESDLGPIIPGDGGDRPC